ncbi:MAG TPA: hypothetical protein VFM51_03565 [Solirubrobacterales bacterium]|nr:hypothetical protein [Solirubrobacterales bacterium]
MKGLLWKLPVLRKPSPLWRGALVPALPLGVMTLAAIPASSRYAVRLSGDFFATAAQLGATLLVAYALESGAMIKALRRRGRNQEMLVGFISALGLSGMIGVAISLMLSEHGGRLSTLELVASAFSLSAIGLLGALVALQPLLIYEWSHAATTEYPDE